jgi:hypothetical protein
MAFLAAFDVILLNINGDGLPAASPVSGRPAHGSRGKGARVFGGGERPAGAGPAVRVVALPKAFEMEACVEQREEPVAVQALVACMRKLPTVLNVMVRTQSR